MFVCLCLFVHLLVCSIIFFLTVCSFVYLLDYGFFLTVCSFVYLLDYGFFSDGLFVCLFMFEYVYFRSF